MPVQAGQPKSSEPQALHTPPPVARKQSNPAQPKATHLWLAGAAQLRQGVVSKGKERSILCQHQGVVKAAGHLQRGGMDGRVLWAGGRAGRPAGWLMYSRQPEGGSGRHGSVEPACGCIAAAQTAAHCCGGCVWSHLSNANARQQLHPARLPAAALQQPLLPFVLSCSARVRQSTPSPIGVYMASPVQQGVCSAAAELCAAAMAVTPRPATPAAGAHLKLQTSGPGAPLPPSPSYTGCRSLQAGGQAGRGATAVATPTLDCFAFQAASYPNSGRQAGIKPGSATHPAAPRRGPSPPTPAPWLPAGPAAEGPLHAAGRGPTPAAPACCCQR